MSYEASRTWLRGEVSQVGAEILSMASEQRSGRDAAWMATYMALIETEIASLLTEMASAELLESDDGVSYRPTLQGKQALDTWNRAALTTVP